MSPSPSVAESETREQEDPEFTDISVKEGGHAVLPAAKSSWHSMSLEFYGASYHVSGLQKTQAGANFNSVATVTGPRTFR